MNPIDIKDLEVGLDNACEAKKLPVNVQVSHYKVSTKNKPNL